jgi:hypothetical protein
MPTKRRGWLCRLGLHNWKKGRRVKGYVVRRCARCPERQEHVGGRWVTVVKVPKRLENTPTVRLENVSESSEGGL